MSTARRRVLTCCDFCPVEDRPLAHVRGHDANSDRCRFQPRRLRPREVVGFQGESVDSFMVVQSGVLREIDVSPDGRERTLRLLFSGDPVGIEGLAQGQHVSSVEAVGRATVCTMPSEHMRKQSQSDPGLAADLIQFLASAHARHTAQLSVIRGGQCASRVAAFLLLLRERAKAAGAVPPQGTGSVALPISRRDIAALLDARPETLSRVLTRFASDGLVETGRDWFRILDEPGLRSVVAGQ